MIRTVCLSCLLAVFAPLRAAPPATQAMRDVRRSLTFRPLSPAERRLEVRDLHVHDLADQKGINITPTLLRDGPPWCYESIVVSRCLLSGIRRTPDGAARGLHLDFLRISGAGDAPAPEADVLIEDVAIRDGDALPIVVQDGRFRSITLRRVTLANTTLGVQLCAIHSGYIRQVLIEDCPGLGVALMGRPGSIGACTIRSSPGARVGDTITRNGRSGATIVWAAAATQPATAPATRPVALPEDRDVTLQGRRYRLIDAGP